MTSTIADGYSLAEVAAEVGASQHTIHSWITKGILIGPGAGYHRGYSPHFLAEAKRLHAWLQEYPRGPLSKYRKDYVYQFAANAEAA
jgi:DNA-binding transcriptional MerR regulator